MDLRLGKVQLLKEVELLKDLIMSKTTYIQSEYYHIYNRGVNRQVIFFENHNWSYFITRLRKYFVPNLVDIIAYCLMPNHYHLLVLVKSDDFSREVMQPFGTSYTKSINKEQGRVGALFQGRFKGKHIAKNNYLLHLSRYIHRNPVDAGLVSKLTDWEFSSYPDFIGQRNGTLPKSDIIIKQFSSVEDYVDFVENGPAGYELVSDLLMD